MKKVISACGRDCMTCDCYLATRSGNQEFKEKVAKEWSEEYGEGLTADDIKCDGCNSGGDLFIWCYSCPIRNCLISKKYESCAQCSKFPCILGRFLYSEAPQAVDYLEKIRLVEYRLFHDI